MCIAVARLKNDRDLRRFLGHWTRMVLRRNKEKYIRNSAEKDKGHFLVNDSRPACQAMRKLNFTPTTTQKTAIHSHIAATFQCRLKELAACFLEANLYQRFKVINPPLPHFYGLPKNP